MLTTLQKYILAALSQAKYDFDAQSKVYVASIPKLPGVVTQAKTIEAARNELAEVVEDWVLVALQLGDTIPPIDGISIPRVNARKLVHA